MKIFKRINKMKEYVPIVFLFLLQFFLLSGLWAVDIGVSAIAMGGETISLVGIKSGSTQYHIGLGMIWVVFFVQLLWLLYFIIKPD